MFSPTRLGEGGGGGLATDGVRVMMSTGNKIVCLLPVPIDKQVRSFRMRALNPLCIDPLPVALHLKPQNSAPKSCFRQLSGVGSSLEEERGRGGSG